MKPKIYVGGPACHKDEISHTVDWLKNEGFPIVSTWHERDNVGYEDGNEGRFHACAVTDYVEIIKADIFLCINMPGSSGGMHTELGISIGMGKEAVVIGKKTQVFHYHPRVQVMESVALWLRSFA